MAKLRYWVDVTLFLVFAGLLAFNGRWTLRFCAGMAMALVAFLFWMTARVQLGSSFSVTAQARKLVTSGLYSRCRYPIYLFGHLAFLGLVIAWGHRIGFLYVLLTIPMQAMRIRKEDAVLEQAFGEEYRAYKAKTWL